jgi:hypothetical protein
LKDSRKTKTSLEAHNPLYTHLEPLRHEIVKTLSDTAKARAVIRVLPLLLQVAIKLLPRATPRQQAAEIPWIEAVFSGLSYCVGQPVPYALAEFPKAEAKIKTSPMANMLQVVHEHGILLSSDFLESMIVDYSGLLDLSEGSAIRQIPVQDVSNAEQDRRTQPEWALISLLLNLDGSIFSKKQAKGSSEQRTSYVDALVTTIARQQLQEDFRFVDQVVLTEKHPQELSHTFEVNWNDSRRTMVNCILIPLMQAYAATRDMGDFLALWFRELRRDWSKIGTPNEECFAWTAAGLCQAFGDLLEGSLTAAKIEDHIVEFSLPIKVLADEVSRSSDQTVDWAQFTATPPASAALVLIDALLQGIEKDESVPMKIVLLLHDLILPYASLNMTQFKCASKIWSILNRIHQLVFRVDSGKALSLCARPETLATATNTINRLAEATVYDPEYRAAFEAYRFEIVVSSNMLTLPELRTNAENLIASANIPLKTYLDKFHSTDAFYQRDDGLKTVKIPFLETSLVLIQYPSCLQ